MKKLIAMLTIVGMLGGCGTIRKLTGRELSSPKPQEPLRMEKFFSSEVKAVLVLAVSFLSVIGLETYLYFVFRDDESSSKDKVVKKNKRSKMKIREIVKKRYAIKRYLPKPKKDKQHQK